MSVAKRVSEEMGV